MAKVINLCIDESKTKKKINLIINDSKYKTNINLFVDDLKNTLGLDVIDSIVLESILNLITYKAISLGLNEIEIKSDLEGLAVCWLTSFRNDIELNSAVLDTIEQFIHVSNEVEINQEMLFSLKRKLEFDESKIALNSNLDTLINGKGIELMDNSLTINNSNIQINVASFMDVINIAVLNATVFEIIKKYVSVGNDISINSILSQVSIIQYRLLSECSTSTLSSFTTDYLDDIYYIES